MLLTHRQLLLSKAIALENDLRGTLRNFGLKVGVVGKVRFEARIRKLVENLPDLAVLVEPMLIVRRVLREQIVILHRPLLATVRDDEVCQRLMTTPGVGPVVSLPACCASAANGHAMAVLPTSDMKSRRRKGFPRAEDHTLAHHSMRAMLCITAKLTANGRDGSVTS